MKTYIIQLEPTLSYKDIIGDYTYDHFVEILKTQAKALGFSYKIKIGWRIVSQSDDWKTANEKKTK